MKPSKNFYQKIKCSNNSKASLIKHPTKTLKLTYGAVCVFFHQRFDLFFWSFGASDVSIFSSTLATGTIGLLTRFVRLVLTIAIEAKKELIKFVPKKRKINDVKLFKSIYFKYKMFKNT